MPDVTCSVEGCTEPGRLRRGMCRPHYLQAMRTGRLNRVRVPRDPVCSVEGCDAPHYGRGFCKPHYRHDYRDRNGVAEAARQAQYIAEDPERYSLRTREYAHRRYMRRNKLASGAEQVDYQSILDAHGMTCHICGGQIASIRELHFDHVIPLTKNGQHVAENIRPSHALCNMRKGDRIIA